MIDSNIKSFLDSPNVVNQKIGVQLAFQNNITTKQIVSHYLHNSNIWRFYGAIEYGKTSMWYCDDLLGLDISYGIEPIGTKGSRFRIEGEDFDCVPFVIINDNEWYGTKKHLHQYETQYGRYIDRILELNLTIQIQGEIID